MELSHITQCYEAYLDGKPVAFLAAIHQPGVTANMKRCSRLVVLPDYQGIGIGYAFASFMAKYYGEHGFVFHLVTSARNLMHKLTKARDWKLTEWSVHRPDKLRELHIKDRRMATFEYIGAGCAKHKRAIKTTMTNVSVWRNKKRRK